MKFQLLALAALLTVASCQRPLPPAQANIRYSTADNVTAKPSRIEAQFEGGVWACVYTGGGASVCLPGFPQAEIEGATVPDVDGALICSNSVNGDYLHLFPRQGTATAKIAGRVFHLLPPGQNPNQ